MAHEDLRFQMPTMQAALQSRSLVIINALGACQMPNPVVFFEIGCQDSASTSEFYSKLFDWNIQPGPMSSHIDPGEGIHGQILSLGHEPHQYTIFYVQVEDVAESIEQTTALGGKAIVGPIDIPIGTFAWVADPGGNTIGLWKPKS